VAEKGGCRVPEMQKAALDRPGSLHRRGKCNECRSDKDGGIGKKGENCGRQKQKEFAERG